MAIIDSLVKENVKDVVVNIEQELANVEPLEEGVDPLEYMLQVAYECEMDLYNINLGIVCEEYQYLRENGTEIVEESASQGIFNVIDKIYNFIQKLWDAIRKFFKAVFGKLNDRFKGAKQFLDKHKETLKTIGTTTLPDGRYIEDQNIKKTTDESIDCLKKMSAHIKDIFSDKYDFVDNFKDELRKFIDAGFGKLNLIIVTGDMVLKAKKPKYKTATTLSISGNQIINTLENCMDSVKDLKEAYEANNKIISEMKKNVKTAESNLKRHKVIPTKESRKVHAALQLLTKFGSLTTQMNRIVTYHINHRVSNAIKTAIVLIKSSKPTDN